MAAYLPPALPSRCRACLLGDRGPSEASIPGIPKTLSSIGVAMKTGGRSRFARMPLGP